MAELIDPALHTAGLAALEGALNRALALAPAGRSQLAGLDGKVFALECEEDTNKVTTSEEKPETQTESLDRRARREIRR